MDDRTRRHLALRRALADSGEKTAVAFADEWRPARLPEDDWERGYDAAMAAVAFLVGEHAGVDTTPYREG